MSKRLKGALYRFMVRDDDFMNYVNGNKEIIKKFIDYVSDLDLLVFYDVKYLDVSYLEYNKRYIDLDYVWFNFKEYVNE